MEKYMFWETTASQIGGGNLDTARISNDVRRLAGAVSLNLTGIPQYGVPIGLQTGGGDSENPTQHVGEQMIEWGDEQIYGPNDDPISENVVSILDEATDANEEESVQVSPVIDSYLYDQLLQKVTPHKKRSTHAVTKRNPRNK